MYVYKQCICCVWLVVTASQTRKTGDQGTKLIKKHQGHTSAAPS